MFNAAIHAGNGESATAACCDNYTTGEHFFATVKAVRPEGVYIDRTGVGSGTISTACWGSGQARAEALSKIRPGDQFEVEVVSWDSRTRTLSLVLPGMKGCTTNRQTVGHHAKPQFRSIPAGTTLLIDFANLIGNITPKADQASYALPLMESVETQLVAVGYKVHFFLERRTLIWVLTNQSNPADKARFQKLCARPEEVTVVCGEKTEADLPILQTAAMLPNAVCVSRDRFRDYSAAFPGIVGSERIRPFTFVRVAGTTHLSIDGITGAIPVKHNASLASASNMATKVPQDSEAPKGSKPTAVTPPVSPQFLHSRETEIRLLSMAARKDPSKYLALADVYSSTDKVEDQKMAAKLYALGMKRAKMLRETRIRDLRRKAQLCFM